MAQAAIPVDLRNPGQVFACLGLMEAIEILTGEPCEGRFSYTDSETHTRFEMSAAGECSPIETVVRFLSNSEVVAIAPRGSGLSTEKWSIRTEVGLSFPGPIPDSPATLPARLRWGGTELPMTTGSMATTAEETT